MAIPVIEGVVANSGTTSTSHVATKPAGVVSGELLIIFVANDSTGSSGYPDTLTGWTLYQERVDADLGGGLCQWGIYYREADTTEAATETITHSNNDWITFYWRISGADMADIFNVFQASATTSASTSHAITGVTTDQDNCLILYGMACDGGDSYPFSVSGTGFAEDAEVQVSAQGFTLSGCVGSRDLATAGASGTATVTSSLSDEASYFQLAINELAAAASTDASKLLLLGVG